MKLERTKNSLRNIFWGFINRITITLVPFAIRTIFIYTLGSEYLGLNSLFSSILTVLNLAELGFSSAIVYNMYKPIAENDTDMICALMNYYRKVYHIIGAVVLAIGIALIPFLKHLINGEIPSNINLIVLYLLYLGNSAISYFLFAYKACILSVYQREDIVSKINLILKILMYGTQAISLLCFQDYYCYVALMIGNTIITNIITAIVSNRYYPQYKCKGNISPEKSKEIKKNIEGLMVGKLCLVSRNAFDNIFISAFLGLDVVTIYGNYYYIMNAISGVLTIIMTSISAGIGNSIATESVEKNYKDYMRFIFMYAWIAGVCTVCLVCLYQPFMKIWMGKKFMFPMSIVILICVYFYSLTMGDVRSQYSGSIGLFWENRHYVLAEAIANIILNYFLGKYFGVVGIILATWISLFFINFGWGSLIIYKYYFRNYNPKEYYSNHFKYIFNTATISALMYLITYNISIENIWGFLIETLVCLIIPNFFFMAIYRKNNLYLESKSFVLRFFERGES